MALAITPTSTETIAVMDDNGVELSTQEVFSFDESQRTTNGIKSENKSKNTIHNTGNDPKRKPSSTKRRPKKPSSTTSLKQKKLNSETRGSSKKPSSTKSLKEKNVKSETESARETTGGDAKAAQRVRQNGRQKDKELNGSSASMSISNKSIESLSNSKLIDIINPEANGLSTSPRNSPKITEKKNSKVMDIIVSGSDGSMQRSSHSRILPQRPALEVARDKKRILEICYGSPKRTLPRTTVTPGKGASTIVLKPVSPDKTLPTDEETDDATTQKERKRKKDVKKSKKKKKKNPKKDEIVVEKAREETIETKTDGNPKGEVGPLDRDVGLPKNGESVVKRSVTKSNDVPKKEGKLIALARSASPGNCKKRKKRRPVVRRDALGRIVRRKKKGKGRGRVVGKECFRKGKDANISLATIDEGFYDDISANSSDEDWVTKSYQSSNISGFDTDEFEDDEQLSSFYTIISSSDRINTNDKSGSDPDFNDDVSNGNDNSESARRVERLQGDDMHGSQPMNEHCDIHQNNNGTFEVFLSNGETSTTTQQVGSIVNSVGSALNSVERSTPNNEDIATPNESGGTRDIVRDSDNNTTASSNIEGRQPSLQSASSMESTACTSTAEVENERDEKSSFLFGSYQTMVCAGVSFVVLVAAATVMIVYFITFRNGLELTPTGPPSASPIITPSDGQRPSLRPSLRPVSTTEPSNVSPTLAPTTILNTLSITCHVPDDKPGTATAETEYATDLFGLASISNANTGYCGEGYITDLRRSGSGFAFRSFKVETTGYYKVIVRYNYVDRTQQSLRLQINNRNEGTLDLVSTGNETSWLIDSIEDVVLREGEHTIGMWIEFDGAIGPSVDWMALSLQKPMTKLEYLNAIIAQSGGRGIQLTLTETRTREWMSNEDPIDWSTLTDREIVERYALAQIYHSAKGEAWINSNQWLSESHVCSWYGITCSTDMFVTDLMLDNNRLDGYLTGDLALLTNLILLSLDNNGLQGIIPTEIGKLTNLSKLFLHANFLSGFLPSELGWLENLETFDMHANFLYGTIPEELFSMVRLESLALASNDLSGTLSTDIKQLKALKNLDLRANELSGTIPSEIGELTLLSSLVLGYNGLTGTIPSELGRLQNLTVLDINSNRLTGILPPELSLLNDTIIDYYGNDIL